MGNSLSLAASKVLRSLVGGSMLFPALVSRLASAGDADENPLAPKQPHFAPKAKRVIFLYMSGGFSHIDSFDPKPNLLKDDGKLWNADWNNWMKGYLKKPSWSFSKRGASGIEVSDLFPEMASVVDDLCIIRSMHTRITTTMSRQHWESHTGSVIQGRSSMGSWVSYGLGTLDQTLPSFVVIAPFLPYGGGASWSAGFIPACHQGIRVTPGAEPIPFLQATKANSELKQVERECLEELNRKHLESRGVDSNLSARIKSFETAAGMQLEAPDVFDLSRETDSTLELYGLKRGGTQGFAWQCLVARRMLERGVRFVELVDSGSNNNWDSHEDMNAHKPRAANVDKAVCGLLKDLKARGLLDDTLVVFTTEFGRAPFTEHQNMKGREHHRWAFTSWLAGAGVKRGFIHGETDPYGTNVVNHPVHINYFHATILHLLGLNHEKLTYRFNGRDFRLTDVAGRVVTEILS